jgi:hypothetical protein
MRRLCSVLVLSLACRYGALSDRDALAAVERYLAAEQAGTYLSDSVRVYGCEDAYQPSTDITAPIARARIVQNTHTRDTAHVLVEYLVLGYAWSGERVAGFRDSVRLDTVDFIVVRDSVGEARIGCGPYPAMHTSVAAFERAFVSYLDSVSTTRWQSALRAAVHE